MAKIGLNDALANVEMTYSEIVDIANDMLSPIIGPISSLMEEIRQAGAGSSVDQIRDFMVRLQLRAFELVDIKEKSALKAQCAEAVRKEAYAAAYNEAEGTAGKKDNQAFLESSEAFLVESLYTLVASMLKTKLDSVHRMIDTLKSVLMSRMQEAKLAMNGID